jgi:hypothetical protein
MNLNKAQAGSPDEFAGKSPNPFNVKIHRYISFSVEKASQKFVILL